MSEAAVDTSSWPSLEKIVLPARAFLGSWIEQTLPARSAAIEDAVEYHRELDSETPEGLRDHAVLGVIGESMQPLEDLAYLATAWDQPLTGLANYVKATVFSKFTASSFWQQAHKRDAEYLEVLAGFRGRDSSSNETVDLLEGMTNFRAGQTLTPQQDAAIEQARQATIHRLQRLLPGLANDWQEFSEYFYAYKHGGLAVHREDVTWVDDDVTELQDSTRRYEPTIAIWSRGGKKLEGRAESKLSRDEIVEYVAGTGRLAVDLVDAFVHSRFSVFDAVEFNDDGSLAALRSMQLAWTIWLRPRDLPESVWKLVGHGPRINWVGGEESNDRMPVSDPDG